jgi:hypothetical protein
MKRLFADTFYYLAVLNPADPAHALNKGYNRVSGDQPERQKKAGRDYSTFRIPHSAFR